MVLRSSAPGKRPRVLVIGSAPRRSRIVCGLTPRHGDGADYGAGLDVGREPVGVVLDHDRARAQREPEQLEIAELGLQRGRLGVEQPPQSITPAA